MSEELTEEGLALYQGLSDDERQIFDWLVSLDDNWPFRGWDIALYILHGDHRATPINDRRG